MNFKTPTIEEKLGKEYTEHDVFKRLNLYMSFYESLSFSVMRWLTQGTSAFVNIDTYAYSSIQGTLESIKMVLAKGRINDSFALLRKYYDVTIINIYTNLYLKTEYDFNSFRVEDIDNWLKGKQSIPTYKVMSNYIKKQKTVTDLVELIYKDDRYKDIRKRCNQNMHYNFYDNLLLNDNEIYRTDRVAKLDMFLGDLNALFVQHFAFIFSISEHYMMSSDYVDHRDMGMEPPEDSQYWVSPPIQEIFSNVVKKERNDIARLMKEKITMQLE